MPVTHAHSLRVNSFLLTKLRVFRPLPFGLVFVVPSLKNQDRFDRIAWFSFRITKVQRQPVRPGLQARCCKLNALVDLFEPLLDLVKRLPNQLPGTERRLWRPPNLNRFANASLFKGHLYSAISVTVAIQSTFVVEARWVPQNAQNIIFDHSKPQWSHPIIRGNFPDFLFHPPNLTFAGLLCPTESGARPCLVRRRRVDKAQYLRLGHLSLVFLRATGEWPATALWERAAPYLPTISDRCLNSI